MRQVSSKTRAYRSCGTTSNQVGSRRMEKEIHKTMTPNTGDVDGANEGSNYDRHNGDNAAVREQPSESETEQQQETFEAVVQKKRQQEYREIMDVMMRFAQSLELNSGAETADFIFQMQEEANKRIAAKGGFMPYKAAVESALMDYILSTIKKRPIILVSADAKTIEEDSSSNNKMTLKEAIQNLNKVISDLESSSPPT